MGKKKISSEHLQELLLNFDKEEKFNLGVIAYLTINIICSIILQIRYRIWFYFYVDIGLIGIIIVIYCIFDSKEKIKIEKDHREGILKNLKNYFKSDDSVLDGELENLMNKLHLYERNYKIHWLFYISFLLIFVSIEIYILSLFGKIDSIINPSHYDLNSLSLSLSIEITFNTALLSIQSIRYKNFRNIRYIRNILIEILEDELKDFNNYIDKIIDMKLLNIQIDFKKLTTLMSNWSDLYLGAYFAGIKEKLLISDYRALWFLLKDEEFYFNFFNELKFKIMEFLYFKDLNQNSKEKGNQYEKILQLIDTNIERLRLNIVYKRQKKEERRNKIKMYQTWIGIISIVFSIIFAVSKLPTLLNF